MLAGKVWQAVRDVKFLLALAALAAVFCWVTFRRPAFGNEDVQETVLVVSEVTSDSRSFEEVLENLKKAEGPEDLARAKRILKVSDAALFSGATGPHLSSTAAPCVRYHPLL